MFQPQMSQSRHLSNSGRRICSTFRNENLASTSDYTDPIYLSETYTKLTLQIRNLRKEISPLILVLKELQEQIDPEFSDITMNQEITQKIASLQAQQYDVDEEISQIRRQYSYETKEKLDIELNNYRIELNESRFDLNETNKMIDQAKIKLQLASKKQNSNSQKYFNTQNQIKKLNSKLISLRQIGSELSKKHMDIINNKQSFYNRIDDLTCALKLIQTQEEKKKSELYKLKFFYENRKKNLLAQIQSKNNRKSQQKLAIKKEQNLNSNFNSSLRRIVDPTSKKTITDKSKKVQILPGIVKNTSINASSKVFQPKEPIRSKTPRINEPINKPAPRSKPKLSLSTSSTPGIPSSSPTIAPPSPPSNRTHEHHHRFHFIIADPTVKVVKMHQNNDECNDFISFS